MEHRYIKIALSLAVGLLASFWFLNNLLNWNIAYDAVAYTLSQQDQNGYPVHIVPPIDHPLATTLVLCTIVGGEGAAGVLALYGALRMAMARSGDADAFSAAKRFAVMGSGIAVLVWFLLFQVMGGALLLMGQSEGGSATLVGAFRFASYSFLTLIYLSLPERSSRTG